MSEGNNCNNSCSNVCVATCNTSCSSICTGAHASVSSRQFTSSSATNDISHILSSADANLKSSDMWEEYLSKERKTSSMNPDYEFERSLNNTQITLHDIPVIGTFLKGISKVFYDISKNKETK